ncbi:exo-beta-1,4-galactosidase [Paludibacter jiangxiensis]|uniref:beta-galactosidase n=1 Tax=Paludibacter jiangxiensis TaxID=681398 RepID=A0A170Z5L4_9BACT|nr:sugar-binding domain-containing protein [Paludibacter jiangxiensis]GAT62344.1 glycosyl hydrolases family 2 [Paludibacter jiangxiensis]
MKKIVHFLVLLVIAQTLLAQQKVSLAGKWQFRIDRNDEGIDKSWYTTSIGDETVRLPGTMCENGKGDDITLKTQWTGSLYDSSFYFNPAMEKYRKLDNLKLPFFLTPNKHYVGVAWYQREIDIPEEWYGKPLSLFLERAHIQTMVWIDNKFMGNIMSMNTPHFYFLSSYLKPGKHRLTIRIDNRLKTTIDPGQNSHSVTDQTQGNWNGIVGRIELQSRPQVHLEHISVFPDLKNRLAKVSFFVRNETGKSYKGNIVLSAKSFNASDPQTIDPITAPFTSDSLVKQIDIALPLNDKMQLWSEFSPTLYKLTVSLKSGEATDVRDVEFGMREIKIEGRGIYVNGIRTMMRGTVENCDFPLTGYAPMDRASWEAIFRKCKSYGLNAMRFHSYCPPEAAFEAADRVGIYLQPEGPSWPNHSTSLGQGKPIDAYLMDETIRMTSEYGNHASFVMLAAGNEPRGNWVAWVGKFVDYWKAKDSRRIYTGASVGGSWAWQPKNQFHVKAGARGLNWDKTRPESMSDFRQNIDTVKQPFISHETGQWCAFPDFTEIPKYTGVKRAKNFELFQENLADNDMADMSRKFLMASGKLQLLCYKHDLEKLYRTPDYAGFYLLGLNDYSGQGTALVGVLNVFWQEKGYVDSLSYRRFCNTTVPLVRMEKFVFNNNETLKAGVEVAHYGASDLKEATIRWKVSDANGNVVEEGSLPKQTIPAGSRLALGNISMDLSKITAPAKLNLQVAIDGTSYANDWNFWVYPTTITDNTKGILVCHELDEAAQKVLAKGGKVLLLAAGKVEYGKEVVQYYQPVFWNTSWFKMRPPHTTGAYIDNSHPIFQNFVTDDWGDLQWWELLNKAQTMQLTDFPKGFHPLVQPIDTWFINRKLGMLFEAQVGKGKIVVCSMDLDNDLENRPVARQLRYSILNYMQSKAFKPQNNVAISTIEDIFRKTAEKVKTYSKDVPDELKKGTR